MRMLTEKNLDDLAIGAAVLGTGGGGDPYIGKLLAQSAIRQHGPVKLLSLDEIGDDDLIVPSAMMGAPTVMVEKIPNGKEIVAAFKAVSSYIKKPIAATCGRTNSPSWMNPNGKSSLLVLMKITAGSCLGKLIQLVTASCGCWRSGRRVCCLASRL